jgi:DNA-binding MarR family transcriptional regulator
MPNVNEYLHLLNQVDETAAGFRSKINSCTMVEYRLLAAANNNPGMHLKELSSQRHLYPQGIGRLAGGMKNRGLIEIQRDPADARARNIILTKKGLAVLDRCNEELNHLLKKAKI